MTMLQTSKRYAEVRRIVAQLPGMLTGRIPDPTGMVRALMIRMGVQAMSYIHQAFLVKSRGGTDEAGEKWKPLSPATVAYSRRHPGLPPKSRRAALRPSAGLSARQRVQWWQEYRRGLAMFKGDQQRAAARAWTVLKAAGAKTIMDRYGNTKVDILRDTSMLLRSITPGVAKDSEPRAPEGVFRVEPGKVTIGTNRKWASVHHHGSRRVPQRRLWPHPDRWPASWRAGILRQLKAGIIELIQKMLSR